MTEQREEVRKVQVTGKSTYIVSLPKKWVAEVKLRRGEQISVIEQDDRSLLLIPKNFRKEKSKEVDIHISPREKPDSLVRKIIAFYLIGYNVIRLTTKERFAPEQRDSIKDFVRRKLVGVEIVADSKDEMMLQILLRYSELSVENALRRMVIITTSMHKDAITALEENNYGLARTVVKTDDEVDRFSFYIIRQLKYAVGDSQVIKDIGLKTPRDCLGYRLITKSVERAADHAVSIARNTLTIKQIDLALFKKMSDMSKFAMSIFEDSINSLFANNYDSADEVLTRKKIIENYDEAIITDITSAQIDSSTVASLRLIVESIRRLAEYGSDIAEVVLNLLVEGTLI